MDLGETTTLWFFCTQGPDPFELTPSQLLWEKQPLISAEEERKLHCPTK